MTKGWDEVTLWALAETLSARMDVIRSQEQGRQKPEQDELPLGYGGNVVEFAPARRRREIEREEEVVKWRKTSA
jgi:hypothetical protein